MALSPRVRGGADGRLGAAARRGDLRAVASVLDDAVVVVAENVCDDAHDLLGELDARRGRHGALATREDVDEDVLLRVLELRLREEDAELLELGLVRAGLAVELHALDLVLKLGTRQHIGEKPHVDELAAGAGEAGGERAEDALLDDAHIVVGGAAEHVGSLGGAQGEHLAPAFLLRDHRQRKGHVLYGLDRHLAGAAARRLEPACLEELDADVLGAGEAHLELHLVPELVAVERGGGLLLALAALLRRHLFRHHVAALDRPVLDPDDRRELSGADGAEVGEDLEVDLDHVHVARREDLADAHRRPLAEDPGAGVGRLLGGARAGAGDVLVALRDGVRARGRRHL
mmetsp:Transcript_59774/g.146852  ORF Transcript_59774/g.146852 Transcript_59774/m.146852 type:complete len:345 (-) Transcript_59774:316-1350(-)